MKLLKKTFNFEWVASSWREISHPVQDDVITSRGRNHVFCQAAKQLQQKNITPNTFPYFFVFISTLSWELLMIPRRVWSGMCSFPSWTRFCRDPTMRMETVPIRSLVWNVCEVTFSCWSDARLVLLDICELPTWNNMTLHECLNFRYIYQLFSHPFCLDICFRNEQQPFQNIYMFLIEQKYGLNYVKISHFFSILHSVPTFLEAGVLFLELILLWLFQADP